MLAGEFAGGLSRLGILHETAVILDDFLDQTQFIDQPRH